jgi:hypothetical protein
MNVQLSIGAVLMPAAGDPLGSRPVRAAILSRKAGDSSGVTVTKGRHQRKYKYFRTGARDARDGSGLGGDSARLTPVLLFGDRRHDDWQPGS